MVRALGCIEVHHMCNVHLRRAIPIERDDIKISLFWTGDVVAIFYNNLP